MVQRFSRSMMLPVLLPVILGVAVLEGHAQTDGRLARRHIEELSDRIGSRLAGSPAEAAGADYIQSALEESGYAVERQSFAFGPEDAGRGRSLTSTNLIAVKPGESDLEIVVGAHYDSEVRGRGAGDNASGVGVLLEVAAAVRNQATPYSIRFVAFGAEEQGLAGSRHFVREMSPEQIAGTVAMINLDSLIVGELAYVYGDPGDAGVLRDWILARARQEGFDLTTQAGANPDYPAGTTCDCSDHAPFVEAGIRYAYFESTNWGLGDRDGYVQVDPRFGEGGRVWHTRFDTTEYIDATFQGRADQRLALFGRMLYLTLTEYMDR